MTDKYKLGFDNVKSFEKYRCEGSNVKQIFNSLPDDSLFTQVKKQKVEGKGSGFNNKDNLLSKQEALEWLSEGGNIGIVLGEWINGYIYASFDIEKEYAINDYTRSIIDNHAILRFKTKHDNTNRVVRISDEKTYELLRSFGETHIHLTDGDSDDIEIITKGHAVIPPSKYNHRNCTDRKPCTQQDRSTQYRLDKAKNCSSLSYENVEKIGELLELESVESDDGDPIGSSVDLENVPSVAPTKNVFQEWEDNVPSVVHDFEDRQNFMLFGDWKGQEQMIQLWYGNFDSISGSQKQHRAECKIANNIGFFFGRNEEIIKFFMDSLPFETKYQKYPKHRKQLLEWASSVDWCYCKGVSFHVKEDIAQTILQWECRTVNEIDDWVGVGKKQIRRTLDILEAEGQITTTVGERNTRVIEEVNITEGYLKDLNKIIERYEGDELTIEDIETHSNVTRTRI